MESGSARDAGMGEYDDGGPWSEVQYRKNNRSRGDGVEWTFLVQNISDRVSRNILWRAFKPYGFVSDVYVARKRDARGKCFGFVRYVGVENVKETLVKMNTVKMFDMKVYVSLAKYDKDHKRFKYASASVGRSEWRPKESNQANEKQMGDHNKDCQPPHANMSSGMGQTGPSFVQNGKSFADLVRGKKDSGNQGAKSVTVEGKGAPYPLHFIGRSVIGYAKDVWALPDFRRSLEAEGLVDFGLSYVGGATFIITVKDNAVVKEVIAKHGSFFASIFSKFKIWNGEDIPFSRIVNLKCSGVPFRIRDNNLFDKIGGLFGDIIKPSAFSWNEEDNSINTVKVLTSYSHRIDEAVVIKWNDKSIITWVSEVPEQGFLNSVNESLYSSGDEESDTESDSITETDDMEEYEEGEIRSKEDPMPESVKMVDDPIVGNDGLKDDWPAGTPVLDAQTVEHQGSVEVQGSMGVNARGESQNLHGEVMGEVHASDLEEPCQLNVENSNKLDCGGPGDKQYGGPNDEVREINCNGPNAGPIDLGPMSTANRGKRNRGERSPPSIGSTQGPSQRLFNHSSSYISESLDLNTLIRENSGNSGVSVQIPNAGVSIPVAPASNLVSLADDPGVSGWKKTRAGPIRARLLMKR
ncbi:putative RNA recognition motif domain, nucleotide-binding alpha-beta plait domain superfamily [Helianthus annuus]|nr:putative RNA recognition motif domain, nucleotide-binding alpha-beta plait domain superfamily [Helianthus annuus]